jgi:hypothetical protein
MYSTFLVSKTACMVCNNQLLKSLGSLQGIFGVEMDRINGHIVVSHTDEVSRQEIAGLLTSMGFPEREQEEPGNDNNEPSVCKCSS